MGEAQKFLDGCNREVIKPNFVIEGLKGIIRMMEEDLEERRQKAEREWREHWMGESK